MRVSLLAAAVVVFAACNKGAPSGSGAVAGACYRDRDNACTAYGPEGIAAAEHLCAGFKWIPGAAGCPKDNRVGACVHDGGKLVDELYAGPPNRFTAAAAKTSCENGGGVFRP